MRRSMFATITIALLAACAFAFSGCEEGPMEEAGEQADEMIDDLNDAAEDAMDEVEDATN